MTASAQCLSPEENPNEFHARNVLGGANKVKTGKAQSYGHQVNSRKHPGSIKPVTAFGCGCATHGNDVLIC
jgi:hypothetical protein